MIRLNSTEIENIYNLIGKGDVFDIIQEPTAIGKVTKVIVRNLDEDIEVDITDYECW